MLCKRGLCRHAVSVCVSITSYILSQQITVSVDVIRECRLWFGIPDIKVLVVNRKKKFLMKYANSANGLYQLFGIGALSEYYS